MNNTLSIQEKNTLIALLNDMLSGKKTAYADDEAGIQLCTCIRSLIDTLNTKDVDFSYVAEHVAQITYKYYALEDYENALATCEISFDYYKKYEEISDEITVGLTQMYWNQYCLLKLCNKDNNTLVLANQETKSRIENYYYEDENQRKALIDELENDRKIYESDGDQGDITFFEALKAIFIKHRRFYVIFCSIAAIWLVTNVMFYLIANNSIYTAIKVYMYDGSSVINRYTNLEIQNDNYKKGEQLRLENKYSDAIPYFEKALSDLLNIYSEDDLEIAQTRMHLGVSYLSVDNLTDAHEQFSNAYVAYRKTLGDNNDNTNEARMYWAITNQLEGDYEAAIRDATDAFDRMKYFGIKQEDSYYLSVFFNRKGDYKLALDWNNRFLGYIDSIVGRLSNYIYIRKANGEILRGDLFLNARELEKSDIAYTAALEDLKTAETAPGKKDFALTINNLRFRTYQRLSEVKHGLGDDESADEMLARALECYGNVGGNDYDSLYLSSINAYKNNSSELPQILLNNLDQTIAINGENNEYTVRQLQVLSEYYLKERNYSDALAVNERSLAIQKNLLAEKAPQSLGIYSNLAACYLGLDDFEQAAEQALEGLKTSTEIYGYKGQRTKLYVSQLVACMNQTQRYENALMIIAICKEIGIPESTNSTLPSWEELENQYMEKVSDNENVTACKDEAEKLCKTINGKNFCEVIEMIVLGKDASE